MTELISAENSTRTKNSEKNNINQKNSSVRAIAVALPLLLVFAVPIVYLLKLIENAAVTDIRRGLCFTICYVLLLYIAVLVLVIIIFRSQKLRAKEEKNKAELANQAKMSFLFNMSHDIRTPMNAILGYTEIALHHKDEPERVVDCLNKIKSSGEHLLHLINDILEMSRIEADKIELVAQPVDIRKELDSVNEMSSSLAIARDITFTPIVGEIANPIIYADSLHISEIIINLISNAIKYTDRGGRVEFRAEQCSEANEQGIARYRFTVNDNGIGMSEEFQNRLFDSFSRENSTTVSKQEGTGLGLAIVKKIVDMAGGTIAVASKQGKGSTFTVVIPFKVLNESEEKQFLAQREKSTTLHIDSTLEGKKVLLVEDNELNREIAMELLSESGLVIDTAEDGSIALRKVKENGTDYYDYVLMDIQMPVMNGYEATAAIRNLPGGDNLTIIAHSANAFKEDVDKVIKSGMNAHVGKPIDITDLLRTMHALSK